MEAGKERLTRDTVSDATRQEIEHLKRENHDVSTTKGIHSERHWFRWAELLLGLRFLP